MQRTETHNGKTVDAFVIFLRKNKGAEVVIQIDGRFFTKHRYAQIVDAHHALETLDLGAIASIPFSA